MTVRLSPEMAVAVAEAAARDGCTPSEALRLAAERGLQASPGAGSTEGLVLPAVVSPRAFSEGVMESRGDKTVVRPTRRAAETGEVLATEKGRRKVQHHDDVVIAGGALVKCRRCTLVKNAGRPEVCDG